MSITLERCAEMRAEMDAGQLRDEVLARAGVSAEEWTVAQRGWLDKMGAELQIGRYEVTNSYTKAFLERQRGLGAPPATRTPAAAALLSRTAALAQADHEGGGPGPPPSAVPVAVLSAQVGRLSVGQPPPARDARESTERLAASPRLPVPLAPDAAPSPPAARVTTGSKGSPLAGTSMGFVAPMGPALPFAAGAAAAPPSLLATVPVTEHAVSPPVKRPPAALSGTSMSFVMPKGPALPFAASAPSSPTTTSRTVTGPAPPPVPPRRVAPPTAAEAFQQVEPAAPGPPAPEGAARGTAEAADRAAETVDIPLLSASAPLPFPSRAAPPEPPSRDVAVDLPSGKPLSAPQPVTSAPPPALTLQQYASLCAELGVFRDRTEATFHKYGLGNLRDRLGVDLAWQERLRRNPAEYQGWQALYQRWVEHFEQIRAGGDP